MTTAATSTPPAIPGLESDPDGARIVAEELKLLQVVLTALDTAAPVPTDSAAAAESEDELIADLRDQMVGAKPEDMPSILEQIHNLEALRARRGKSVTGVADRQSPYFGHLRLEETVTLPGRREPQTRRRDVLVGTRSYLDARSGIRIVDWRQAPVSRIYYRYREEDDFEEMLGDQLTEGVVVARRSVAIQEGVLRRVACPQGTFLCDAAGRWSRVDARRATLSTGRREASAGAPRLGIGADGSIRKDKLLPEIAAMLDKDQFDIITRPGAGLVAIQGSAGSGKTTVGLHRVAYLHASEPTRFKAARMLVIVPNEALIHYTSRVLPSLGVDGVPVMTFERWAVRALFDLFPRLPSRFSTDTPPVVSRAKGSGAILRLIDRLVERVEARVDTLVAEFAGKWSTGALVAQAWGAIAKASRGRAPDQRVSQLGAWLAGKREVAGAPKADGIDGVTRRAAEALGQELRQHTRGVLALWDELCTNEDHLREALAPAFGPGQIRQVHEWCVRQARIRQEGERDGETPTLDGEDMALILRVFQALRGPLVDAEGTPLRVAHLFVDEVQDYPPVPLKVLLDIATSDEVAKACVTLAGDVAQRMLEDDDEREEADWRTLLVDLGMDPERGLVEPLKVSYRSTAEITAFARGVLGPYAHDAEPIADRQGPPVELFPFSSPGEAVAFLADALRQLAADEPDANVAILARFPQQADVYFEGLLRAEVPNVRRVAKQDFTWAPGVEVTDVRQTKGLEFDEVVLVETGASSYPDSSQARHALYVGATRAAHQLWCIATEKPSKLVAEGLASMEQAEQAFLAAHPPS